MATTSSGKPPAPPTVDVLRGHYLPRAYLHRSLVRRMAQRLDYIAILADRARDASGVANVYRSIDLLYHTWLLIEQVRKVYELVASHVDARFPGKRRSLDSRINNPRSPEQEATYHHRVWLYPLMEVVPDSAFVRLGFDADRSRELFQAIADRSATRLAAEEADLCAFYDRYGVVCDAYKHGRAIFAMEPTITATGVKTGMNIRVSSTMAAILLADEPNAAPHAFVTITPDTEFWTDVDRVLVILERQVPRLLSFVEAFATMSEAAIPQIEAGTNNPLPSIPFFVFGEPYSDDEQALLAALRRGELRLYETP
jgi:hypothetical protein